MKQKQKDKEKYQTSSESCCLNNEMLKVTQELILQKKKEKLSKNYIQDM